MFVFDLYFVDVVKKGTADLPVVEDLFFDLFGKYVTFNKYTEGRDKLNVLQSSEGFRPTTFISWKLVHDSSQ